MIALILANIRRFFDIECAPSILLLPQTSKYFKKLATDAYMMSHVK